MSDKATEPVAKGKEEKETPLGLITPKKVAFQESIGDSDSVVTLYEFEHEDLSGAVVVEGFPSSTLCPVLASAYIVETLKLPLIGFVGSDHLPARALVNDCQPSPPIRINGNKDIVVFQSEFKVENPPLLRNLCKAVISFTKRNKASLLCTIDAFPSERMGKEVERQVTGSKAKDKDDEKAADAIVHYLTTDEKFAKFMKDNKFKPLENAIVSGFTGLVLAEAGVAGSVSCEVACLLAPTVPGIPDAHAAVDIVTVLDLYLKDVPIDTSELKKRAQSLEVGLLGMLRSQHGTAKARHNTMYT